MIVYFIGLVLTCWHGNVAALPSDCRSLENHVLDQFDPQSVLESTSEIAQHQPPLRVGNLRQTRPLPTGHFATSQLKANPAPMVLWPYFSTMNSHGIVYDPFEFKRFWDPERTILADQQSAWQSGQPWHRLLDLGTNMFQKVSGPDGNKLANFNGDSGIRVGIAGSGEPVLEDYGDLYANFMYTGNGGSMEVPLTRGSILLTHKFQNANPVLKPNCLDTINGEKHTFNCPNVPGSSDGGSGYLSAACSGSTLTITLHNTRPIKDMSRIQWAANRAGAYSGSHGMHNCNSATCRLLDGGKQLQITVHNAAGVMSYAVNYIGHYVLPPDWINHPQQVTCSSPGKRAVSDLSVYGTCDSNNNVKLQVELAGNNIAGIEKIQYAIEPADNWVRPPMYTCDPAHCTRQGNVVTIRKHMPSGHLKLAVNIIGWMTLPYHWFEHPLEIFCGSGHDVVFPSNQHHTPAPAVTPAPTQPQTTTETVTTSGTGGGGNIPVTTNGPSGGGGNIPGGHPLTAGQKFVLELNEPGSDLPSQTRKFVLFFSSSVTPHVHSGSNTVTFSPTSGGNYNGIMQLGFLGSGPRGNHQNDSVYDNHFGVYPYKPQASFCVSDSANKAYVTFDWHADNRHATSPLSSLLMLTMPHHAYILQKTYSDFLTTTPFGFQGYMGGKWEVDMDLPRASMAPDPKGVALVNSDHTRKQEMLAAIARDANNVNLDGICSRADSYNVGKSIGMVSRLASISRAFNTNHFHKLDESIKNCLEKWLRIQDTLSSSWRFQYDTVWGGLFLRATEGKLNFGYDYGFPFYNDHHFHLGYFLYALAYYVQHNPSWGQANRHRIYLLARDVSNPSPQDPYFPTFRQKDIYTGFSWASGIVPGSRQEESASESLNCYHGVAALGEAMNDDVLKHTGQVMLAMEVLSVREYWQVRADNRNHFPPIIQDTGVVGQIAEDSFYVYTLNWPCDPNRFPMRHACLVGIQVIPITAVSKYWMDKEWAGSIKHVCTAAIHPQGEPDYHLTDPHDMRTLNTGWAAFCHAAMAPLDASHQSAAAAYVKDKRPQELVSGTGAASTLLFIYGST